MKPSDKLMAELDEIASTPVDMMKKITKPEDVAEYIRSPASHCMKTGGEVYLDTGSGIYVLVGGNMSTYNAPNVGLPLSTPHH